jgi:hypothetical protein
MRQQAADEAQLPAIYAVRVTKRPLLAALQARLANVRFGSKADITATDRIGQSDKEARE